MIFMSGTKNGKTGGSFLICSTWNSVKFSLNTKKTIKYINSSI